MRQERILVAVDLTTDEASTVIEATEVLTRAGAKLHAITVLPPLGLPLKLEGVDEETMERITADAAVYAGERLREIAKPYGVDGESVYVRAGKPADVILALADELGVDLIVIGKHARRGEERTLGSAATSILNGASKSVLVVKI